MPAPDLGAAIRGFFEHHLVSQRGLSAHTVLAYRDTMKLLLEFTCQLRHRPVTVLEVGDLTNETVRRFLEHLEHVRHNSIPTRNLRLAAIHSFFRYLAVTDPRYLDHCQSILLVPFKRRPHRVPEFLDRDEVQHIFRGINVSTPLGRRDDALLRLLYNTGMRAHEIVSLDVNHIRFSRPYTVLIHGKGQKERVCPLWKETVDALKRYLADRNARLTDTVPLFLGVAGSRLSRFGIRYIVSRRVAVATKSCPSLRTRHVTPHTWRHATALHLLQSNVDLTMIRSWLGHSSVQTTHQYVEIDLEMKRKTLKSIEHLVPRSAGSTGTWKAGRDILAWLSAL
ncbi:MAG TPA: tyrosine-type recombinase/integrase [Candidatus Didemnitutus sp.]|nr:tyrosine-type recombinase/integrase [Candidatus Didemnitutus sp.]